MRKSKLVIAYFFASILVGTALCIYLGVFGDPALQKETPLPPLTAPHVIHETELCKILARNLNGEVEFRLGDGTRVDILTDEYAIEVDWAPKWAESIGQCLYYAEKTDRKPMSLLLIESESDKRYIERLMVVARVKGIEVRTFNLETRILRKEE